MKKISVFILACALCFCALLTGCVDIWQGIEGDERVYEMSGEPSSFFKLNHYSIRLKRDNTVELIETSTDNRLPVSRLGDEYADYNAQFKSSNVVYGTYKQIGNRLKITFEPYTEYCRVELSGEDAEAFKTAYIENHPDRAEMFGKGELSKDSIIMKKLTLSVSNDECKPLSFAAEDEDVGIEKTWTYYSSGQIKSYKSVVGNSKVMILKFNTDGSYTRAVYINGMIYSYVEYDSNGNWIDEREYRDG